MNLIYNSDQYTVVEFTVDEDRDALRYGGYEIMDKPAQRETFIGGVLAETFRKNVQELIASEPTVEDVDNFLGKYDAMMRQPMVMH